MREYPSNLPRRYAREKLSKLLERKRDPKINGLTVRYASVVFPGVPVDVFHGFTAFTTHVNENTTVGKSKTAREQKFHEVGLYQVPAGPRSGPAPNLDRHAPDNGWGKYHDDPLVQQLLGRKATMKPDGWKSTEGGLEDQIAVGLVNLKKHADTIRQRLGAAGAADLTSDWYVLCGFTAFSRGNGLAFQALKPYLQKLALVPEDERWRRLRELVVLDCSYHHAMHHEHTRKTKNHCTAIGWVAGKQGTPYALIRSEQKYESGVLLARHTGGDLGWFVSRYGCDPIDETREDVIGRAACNVPLKPQQIDEDAVEEPAPGPMQLVGAGASRHSSKTGKSHHRRR